MGRLDFVFLELSGAPLNEKLQRKNLSSTHTRRGIHRPYPTQLKQEHTSNKPGYKHHKDPREILIYKIFKKKNWRKFEEKSWPWRSQQKTAEDWRNTESRKSTKKSKKQSKWVKTIQLMRFILREWNNKRLHPLINFLMVSHFYFLANFWWPRLFLIVPDLSQDGLPFVRFSLGLIEVLFRLWIRRWIRVHLSRFGAG